MRKLGFTLAEVLITLGIIGVIATLTMPTLMSNTAEREYSTALKKAVSALTEAIQMNVALENTSFDELYDQGGGPGVDSEGNATASTEVNSLEAFLLNRMQTERYVAIDGACDSTGKGAGCVGYSQKTKALGDSVMFFRDGSAIIFKKSDTIDTNKCIDNSGEEVQCFQVVYDVNGVKKPNITANCSGDKKKESDPEVGKHISSVDGDGNPVQAIICNKDNFIARDQYPLALYGLGAHPNSPAAQYMWERK